MPSVTMKLGTLRSVTIRPFTSPMNAPNASMKANTGSAFASSWPMRLPAITTCAVTTEPIDRSNSPPTMTKYWPIATIAIGATRCTKRMSCDGSANDGFSSVMATSSTMSSRNTAPRGLTSVRPSVGEATAEARPVGGHGGHADASCSRGGIRRRRAAGRPREPRPAPVERPARVHGDGGDDDDAAHDVLQERVHLHDAHHVVDDREDRDAADGAPDRAAAAHEQRAAEHDRRDREQVVAALDADGGAADAEPAGEQEPGERGGDRAEHVRDDQRARGADAGEAGDLLVAADGEHVVAGARAAEEEGAEHGDERA